MKKKEAKTSSQTRARAFFSGRVQGVGFRYTAEKHALDRALTGWVKNLADGRVEIVCEGPKSEIEAFFDQLRGGHLGPHIKKTTIEWFPATGEFDDFRVEFCC